MKIIQYVVWITLPVLAAGIVRAQDSTQNAAPSVLVSPGRTVSAAEVKRIAGKLMAPCCWSQTADVHTSGLAKEMQVQIRSALQQGYTEPQILAAFVAEYGERILAQPRAAGFNLMVWILPGMALGLGGFAYWRFVQRARAAPAAKPVPAAFVDENYAQRFERELADAE